MRLRAENLYVTEVEGDTIILDTVTSRYLRVNRAGTVLLEHLDHEVTTEELVSALAARFEIEMSVALADTEQFLAQLRANDFLRE